MNKGIHIVEYVVVGDDIKSALGKIKNKQTNVWRAEFGETKHKRQLGNYSLYRAPVC